MIEYIVTVSTCPATSPPASALFCAYPERRRLRRMERLKSSLKSLHGAITDVKPTVPTSFHLHGNDSPTTSSNPSLVVDQSYLTMPSSSSSRTIRAVDDIESFALGKVSSKRFFFSPLTTNSIMEEAKLKAANGEHSRRCSFCDGCTTVAIASRDPYRDFRASMEEMVAAHGLREWPRLEELLHCYLRLNEEKHHRVIVLAFAYLLLQF